MNARRKFLKKTSLISAGGYAFLKTGSIGAAIAHADEKRASSWPGMAYRKLGVTNFNASRLVYGCGAALSRRPANRLLSLAFDQGVNVFDTGFDEYYGDSERNMASFVNTHSDNIFVISKAWIPGSEPGKEYSPTEAKKAGTDWLKQLDRSLRNLKLEHVDAYYVMSANNSSLARSEEMRRAFEKARDAGKVSHWGLSSHQNASEVLQAAIDTGWYSLVMIAITPAGWYDWEKRDTLNGTPDMKTIRPMLDIARQKGIGLVGMKAGRLLAGASMGGRGNGSVFNSHYSKNLQTAPFNDFQKSYAFVLENGLDVVNADIQNVEILEENFAAAAMAEQYVV